MAIDPSAALYLPCTQLEHVDSAVAAVDEEYFPGPQLVHAVLAVDPVCMLYLPGPQLEQDAWPTAP